MEQAGWTSLNRAPQQQRRGLFESLPNQIVRDDRLPAAPQAETSWFPTTTSIRELGAQEPAQPGARPGRLHAEAPIFHAPGFPPPNVQPQVQHPPPGLPPQGPSRPPNPPPPQAGAGPSTNPPPRQGGATIQSQPENWTDTYWIRDQYHPQFPQLPRVQGANPRGIDPDNIPRYWTATPHEGRPRQLVPAGRVPHTHYHHGNWCDDILGNCNLQKQRAYYYIEYPKGVFTRVEVRYRSRVPWPPM
ncbi:MAG: hypothetical protein M1820_003718 [Bogoriella megaspora]|nr:MAG: hypothetical protein M1820_003718 [Bogoriella megaspora]